jgi:hypothetical protein
MGTVQKMVVMKKRRLMKLKIEKLLIKPKKKRKMVVTSVIKMKKIQIMKSLLLHMPSQQEAEEEVEEVELEEEEVESSINSTTMISLLYDRETCLKMIAIFIGI